MIFIDCYYALSEVTRNNSFARDSLGKKRVSWICIVDLTTPCQWHLQYIPWIMRAADAVLCYVGFDNKNFTHILNSSPPGQMASISQMIFSYAFSWKKSLGFPDSKVHGAPYWSHEPCYLILIKRSLKFVPKVTINSSPNIGLDNGLAPNRRQAIIWTYADPIHWCIFVAPGGDASNNTSQAARQY